MSAQGRQMREDRALRNAALSLVKADIANLRGDLALRSPAQRVGDQAKDIALDIAEEASELASDNKGIAAGLFALVALWFARNPILSLLFGRDTEDEEEGASGPTYQDGFEEGFDHGFHDGFQEGAQYRPGPEDRRDAR